jgi:hypothetical protein
MAKFELNRRNFLRGAAYGSAIAVGVPILDALLNVNGTAFAQGAPLPRRLGVFFWGNGRGVLPEKWTPGLTGPDYALSELLTPLAAHKDYINVVSGMDVKLENSPRGHHRGCVGILSGADFIEQAANGAPYRSTFSMPSIDQVAANVIGQDTPFRSLEIGISRSIVGGEGTTLAAISHNGPDNANTAEHDPAALYDRVFAGNMSGGSPVDPGLAQLNTQLRTSVLDAVLDDITRLDARVGARDKVRLQQHYQNVRDIEDRLAASANSAAQCQDVMRPSEADDDRGHELLAERLQAMTGLVTLALACDMTRVFSILYHGSVSGTVFWQVGADRGHHELSHEGEAAQTVIEASTVYTMEQFATMLQAFKDVPEATGHLLDSSAILATSDTSDGAAHSENDYPIVIAGAGGGFLKHPGVHYASDGENTSMALLSLLKAAGTGLTEVGGGAGHVTTSCSAIEA